LRSNRPEPGRSAHAGKPGRQQLHARKRLRSGARYEVVLLGLYLVTRWASTKPQSGEFLTLARRVAQGLVAPGKVLRRRELSLVRVPGRGLQREIGIRKVRPAERDEVGLS